MGTLIFSCSNKEYFEIFSSQYYAGYRFVIYSLYYVDLEFLDSPWLLSWKAIGFCQRLFMYLLRLWYYFCVWIHLVMNYIYLHWTIHAFWNDPNLTMMKNFFLNLILNLACKYFIEKICIYVHKKMHLYFLCLYLVWGSGWYCFHKQNLETFFHFLLDRITWVVSILFILWRYVMIFKLNPFGPRVFLVRWFI